MSIDRKKGGEIVKDAMSSSRSSPPSSLFREMLAATGAGIASTVLGHPLDTIKTHLQTQSNAKSTWQVARTLNIHLFRGIAPPMVNAIVMNTVMFSVFDSVKEYVGDGESSSGRWIAGFLSGVATAMISTPTDYLKIHAQLNKRSNSKSSLAAWSKKLYTGNVVNIARESVFTMIYLGLYDYIMMLSSSSLASSLDGEASSSQASERSTASGLVHVAAVSSLTGGLAWVASYPIDTVKSIRQSSHESSFQIGRRLFREGGGVAAFYKGCFTSTGRAILVTSSRMVTYQYLLHHESSPQLL